MRFLFLPTVPFVSCQTVQLKGEDVRLLQAPGIRRCVSGWTVPDWKSVPFRWRRWIVRNVWDHSPITQRQMLNTEKCSFDSAHVARHTSGDMWSYCEALITQASGCILQPGRPYRTLPVVTFKLSNSATACTISAWKRLAGSSIAPLRGVFTF